MKPATKNYETSHHIGTFTTLDVVGISLSTLLFTLVWVGVFSVFLPEKSEMLLSDGLRQLASKNSSRSSTDGSLTKVLQGLQSYTRQTAVYALSTSLSVLQTGGNLTEIVSLTRKSAQLAYCEFSYCTSAKELARASEGLVLGESISESIPFGKEVLGGAIEYLNTVTFGLVQMADSSFYHEYSPVQVVQKNGSVFHCSGNLCMARS